jgi:hypothetical protein
MPRLPRNGERGYFPDHDAERREAFKRTTPGPARRRGNRDQPLHDEARVGRPAAWTVASHRSSLTRTRSCARCSRTQSSSSSSADSPSAPTGTRARRRTSTSSRRRRTKTGGASTKRWSRSTRNRWRSASSAQTRCPCRSRPRDSTKAATGRCRPTRAGLTSCNGAGVDEGYERLHANALQDDVPGVGRLAFAGYDDLVTMKQTAGRPEDELDLLRLERARGEPPT